jgi:hypothetical protein
MIDPAYNRLCRKERLQHETHPSPQNRVVVFTDLHSITPQHLAVRENVWDTDFHGSTRIEIEK